MQPPAQEISTCPVCGGALEETSGGGLGCMVCLLRVGIWGEDPAGAGQDSTLNAFGRDEGFGAYEIERLPDGSLYELGRGAMGVTYRAVDTSLQRKAALKIIKIGIAGRRAEAHERFMREARMAAALRHENIATVFQFGIREETGQCFYAMELIDGETLEDRVRRAGPLDVCTTIDIARQVTAALIAAEKRGLIHRDLKPANLMLVSPEDKTAGASTQRGGYNNVRSVVATALRRRAARNADRTERNDEKLVVKIIDFGLAKFLNAPVDPMRRIHAGFVGTPAFASPEQFEHSELDARSDIYSLGVTLWFVLTSKTPFAGHSVEEIRRAQQSNALPMEQLKAAHVPSHLRLLIKSMLAAEPAARPSTHELAAQLQRCAAEVSPKRIRGTHVAVAAAATLILGASALFVFHPLRIQNAPLNPAAPEKSIAVLPFENLSSDPNNAYFAKGVQDEILTDMARIADLKVVGRTSVMPYKSEAARNLRKIGKQLGVAHLVKGSVQRSGNRVRVNAQLVHASTERRLWGHTYDGDLADFFGIQSRIAMAIADELHAKLSPNEKSEIERPPTTDIIAFDLYSRANDILSEKENQPLDFVQAIDLLNQAVARDPSFFRAYCQTAYAHVALYFFGHDRTSSRLALAEAALQAASRLRPDAGETHLARAWNLYSGYLDYDGALAELKVARQTLPNDPQILFLTGLIQRRQGHWEESTRTLERAADLDPRNFGALHAVAANYATLRRYAEQQLWLNRILAFEPDNAATKVVLATVDFESRADTQPLHQIIDSVWTRNPAAVLNLAHWWLDFALAEREAAAAKEALIAAGEDPINLGNDVFCTRPFVEGVIARMVKDDDKARSAFTAARVEQEKIIQAQPDFGPPWCVLGLIDAALGRKEEALREGRHAVELLPVEKDAVSGPAMIKYLAMIAAWAGDKDLACQQLAIVARPPSPVSYGQLKLLPFWDPLRGDPRFEQIVASLGPRETPNVIH
jgi:serine/threonine protein kinase/Tfp pilus assembly protein PilF